MSKGWRFGALGAPVLALLAAPSAAQLRFTQDFERLKPGSDGSPALQPIDPGWSVEDGRYVQSAAEGRYDQVAFFPTYLRGRVLLRVKLAHRSTFLGGGLVFASSSRERIEHATMVRFDGAQELLYGTFRAGVFEPDGRLFVPKPIVADAWIELAVECDEVARSFSVKVDGEVVGASLPLRTGSGYAGLQVSNGRVAFDDVYAEIQRDLDRAVRWPSRFALLGDAFAHVEPVNGRLVAADRESDGDLQVRALAGASSAISALASRRSGGFAALEGRAQRVRIFGADGREERVFTFQGLDGAVDLDVDAAGRAHVLAASGDVLVLDAAGVAVASGFLPSERRGAGQFRSITVRSDGRGLILDGATQRAIETHIAGDELHFGAEHAIPADVRDAAFARAEAATEALLYLACGSRVEARRLSDHAGLGAPFETFASETERLDAIALDVAPAGWIAVADRANQRFLRLPPELSQTEPRFGFDADGGFGVSWIAARAAREIEAELSFSDGAAARRAAKLAQAHAGREQRVRAEGLPRGVSLRLVLPSECRDSVPASAAQTYSFRSPAPVGERHLVRLPVLAFVYTDVRHRAPSEALLPEPEPLSADERARIEAELREGAAFYWVNSGFRLWLDLAVHFIDEPQEAGAIHAGGELEGEPLQSELEARARALHLELDAHACVLVVSARRSYDVAAGEWTLQGRGGGLTIGPEARGSALSWWTAPPFHGAQCWLLVHELHHQLDALLAAVGHPEYWFNHFSPTLGTAARFGEHHDGNAYLLRQWPDWKWWALLERPALAARQSAFGSLYVTRDTDGDGLPDADPRLPLDEERFGSAPDRSDTDGDGLDDGAEARLLIRSALGGAGWTQAVFAARPSPRLRDADGDGSEDGRDEEPLYRVTTEIPAASADSQVDGALARGEARALLAVSDPHFALELAASHAGDALHLFARLDRPGSLVLLLDGSDDGWFVGRENYRLRLDSAAATPTLELVIHDAATPGRWPFETRELVPSTSITWRAEREPDGATRFELRLPSSRATGFRIAAGRSFGLAVAVATAESESAGRGHLSVFEPHRFVRFRLVD